MTPEEILIRIAIAVAITSTVIIVCFIAFLRAATGKEPYGYEIVRADGTIDTTFGYTALSAYDVAMLRERIARGENIRILYRPKRVDATPEQVTEQFKNASNYQDYLDGKL